MNQLKIFEAPNVANVELYVNQWFKENPEHKIISVALTSYPSPSGRESKFVLTVVYEKGISGKDYEAAMSKARHISG